MQSIKAFIMLSFVINQTYTTTIFIPAQWVGLRRDMVKKLPISPPHISLVLSCVFMQTELYVKMSVSKCFYKVRARAPCWEYFSYQHFLTVFRHSDSGWKVAHCLQTYSICREAGRSSLSNQAEQDAIGK